MINFLIFLLSTIGLTLIITHSYLFKNIRKRAEKINKNIGKLFRCPQCMGFYVAILIQYVIIWHERMSFDLNVYDLYYILYGFIGSFACYTTYLLIKPLIDKYD
jgi:hypothetical protein